MVGEHGTVRLQRLLGCEPGFAAFRAQHVDAPVGSGDGTLAVIDGGVYAAALNGLGAEAARGAAYWARLVRAELGAD